MPTDPLDAYRNRWKDAPPLDDVRLLEMIDNSTPQYTDDVVRLVAEIMRLRGKLTYIEGAARSSFSNAVSATGRSRIAVRRMDEQDAEIARLHALIAAGHTHGPFTAYCTDSGNRGVGCDSCGATWEWPDADPPAKGGDE